MAGSLPVGTTAPRGLLQPELIRWPLVAARDLFELKYGKALVDANRRPGSVPVYGTNGRCGSHDEALFKGPGVILGRKGQGPLGVEWSNDDYWVIDTAYALAAVRSGIDLRYAYFLIKFIGLNHLKDGTSNPTLSRDTFGAQALPLPPLGQQRAIAYILGTLDDKIELNRRMNETLEAMARAIFKSWFVDFLPVRAKMAARTQTGDPVRAKHALSNVEGADGRDPGLPKPLADLFPDSFEDSELGEIPAGWEVVNLNDVADINYGQNLPQTELLGCGIPVFGAAGVIGYYSEAMFKDPIVLVTSRGSGSGTVHETHGPSFVTNNSFSVIPKDGWFSRHYLKASLLNGDISSLVTGSAQPQLTITNFSYLKLVRPAERVVRKFHSFADSLWQKKNANQEESHTLAALRDTLLPRLLSGEIRLKDVQTVTEEVL